MMSKSLWSSQNLRRNAYGVRPKRPKKIRDAKRILYNEIDHARADGHHMRLNGILLYLKLKLKLKIFIA